MPHSEPRGSCMFCCCNPNLSANPSPNPSPIPVPSPRSSASRTLAPMRAQPYFEKKNSRFSGSPLGPNGNPKPDPEPDHKPNPRPACSPLVICWCVRLCVFLWLFSWVSLTAECILLSDHQFPPPFASWPNCTLGRYVAYQYLSGST